MTAKFHALFWSVSAALLVIFVLIFQDVLTPFVLGITIAYLLNPLVVFFEKKNISRTLATVIILSLFFLFFSLLIILLIPPLYREIAQLIEVAPDYMQMLVERLQPFVTLVEDEGQNGNLNQGFQEMVRNNLSNAFNFGSSLLGGLLSGGRAVIGFFSLLLITPLVAFFLMREWTTITKKIDDLLPRHDYKELKKILAEIDGKIAGFVRGQLIVALLLGIIYALALSLAGLEFGFLIGMMAGALSIIPLFGSITGLVVSVVVAWIQATSILYVALIAAIFLIGQIIEGNVITPKVLGGSVGMHPLWILFAIMAGASLFGIVGMMIAVPVAATIGVLANFALEKYQNSNYYKAE